MLTTFFALFSVVVGAIMPVRLHMARQETERRDSAPGRVDRWVRNVVWTIATVILVVGNQHLVALFGSDLERVQGFFLGAFLLIMNSLFIVSIVAPVLDRLPDRHQISVGNTVVYLARFVMSAVTAVSISLLLNYLGLSDRLVLTSIAITSVLALSLAINV